MSKKTKPARGLVARGAKGACREKLAKAAGFRSDADISLLFPENRQKQARQLQQSIADLVGSQQLGDLSGSAIAAHYSGLMHALANPEGTTPAPQPVTPPTAVNDGRTSKQAALATDALRQMVLEAIEAPLAMLPSLLADGALNDQEKLNRLAVYAAALEAVYEPLELEAIGDLGEAIQFDPRVHDSAASLSKGDTCSIRQIGFRRGSIVLRKAVVVAAE